MKRFLVAVSLVIVALVSVGRSDLTLPASFEVVEEKPNQFRMTLTVPLVKGRYLKVKPVVPDGFQSKVEPEVRAGEASLTRSWLVEAERSSLYNGFFGLEGLLGTSAEVRFLLTTLEGRRFEAVLRPTRSLFMVPEPESVGVLVSQSGREGMRHAVRSLGLWALLACILFSGMSTRNKSGVLVIVVAGFLGTWAVSMGALPEGLSDKETGVGTGFLLAGCLAGTSGMIVVLGLVRSLVGDVVRSRVWMCCWILASAWLFFQSAGLVYHHGLDWVIWIEQMSVNLLHLWFSPFAADWAMARLRVPVLSLSALVLFVVAMVRIRPRHIQVVVSLFLLVMVFILLPYGVAKGAVPFATPGAPSAKQAHRIIEPMLAGIYQALNLEDEGLTYDRLAEQVSSNLVGDLYLDSRRRLVAGTREGASVVVKQVEVEAVQSLSSADGRHHYRCEWAVTAKVEHWQHTHERRNLYEGDLVITVEGGVWKLAALNLRSEERKVVPGSFSSR